MGSLDIFVENINRLAAHYHLDTYADIAQFYRRFNKTLAK